MNLKVAFRLPVFFSVLLLCTSLGGCGSQTQEATQVAEVPAGERPAAERVEPAETVAEQPPEPSEPAATRESEIERADRLAEAGKLSDAVAVLTKLLIADPADVEVVFRLAGLKASDGDLSAAIELLDTIPADHPEAGLPALGQSADWCLQIERYDDAEKRFERILESVPDAGMVHRQLAFLFNRQGRRHEAAQHVRSLCRQGDVLQDELHSLIQLTDAMYDPPNKAPATPNDRLYIPIGVSGAARKLFTDEKFQEAVDLLNDSIRAKQQPPSVVAFFGRAAAEAQDDAQLQWWLANADEATKGYAEYWAALGTALWTQRKPEPAIRALLESLDRDPRDFRTIVRLRAALRAIGREEEAELWTKRWQTLRDVSAENNKIAGARQPDTAAMLKLATLLDSLDRKLESVVWRYLAGLYGKAPQEEMQALQLEMRHIVEADEGFPDRPNRLCGMQLDEFPLPPEDAFPKIDTEHGQSIAFGSKVPTPARFQNIAGDVGLAHAYRISATEQANGFAIYQSFGGGVAVIDYDLDGNADLYFAQGGSDPPDFIGGQANGALSNLLYRNEQANGRRLSDVTGAAKLNQRRYTTGVTVGDWNQDGFPDLVVANIGSNSLWINSGDGTFRQEAFDDRDNKSVLTTSLALGDLNGDALPDVFELNYLDDPDIGARPDRNEQGQVINWLRPGDFDPAKDRIGVNDGRGAASFSFVSDADTASANGLGVVLGDFDAAPGNEVFVTNDTDPNQLWVAAGDSDQRVDVAMAKGCAFAFDGVPTAAMGIAAGDFDRNGALDFHVTNFHDESVCLYLREGELFQDRKIRFQLAEPSSSVLGFGTQAIDYDNDGMLDLAVTNGHIEQSIVIPEPFEQPPQMFANLGNRFEWVPVEDASGYWGKKHVGRSLTRLDFDRDGRSDFVITHLAEPSALLVNQTRTDNHWLQVRLIGTQSERDAIGARVEIVVSGRRLTEWLVSGDGFFSKNESVLSFGLGDRDQIESLTVTWPTGLTQEFRQLESDRRWVIIEGTEEAFADEVASR